MIRDKKIVKFIGGVFQGIIVLNLIINAIVLDIFMRWESTLDIGRICFCNNIRMERDGIFENLFWITLIIVILFLLLHIWEWIQKKRGK